LGDNMSILEQLKNNKGTVSNALRKTLVEEILQGKKEILKEAVELASYRAEKRQEKSLRSGAAKIIECVAMEKPSLVSPYLGSFCPPSRSKSRKLGGWLIERWAALPSEFRRFVLG
jgi:hypothetical protein